MFTAALPIIIPTVLPVGFLLTNLFAKFLAGQRTFYFAGADMAICGWAMYSAVLFRQILAHALVEADIVWGILRIFVAFLAWGFCIWLGSFQARGSAIFAGMVGTATFSLSGLSAWGMLE